ncbi:MAG: hypothetical protein HY865_15960 [Chloroflexi bacterium]|nr:hypothetical protein [Chloroflexota bacterium]
MTTKTVFRKFGFVFAIVFVLSLLVSATVYAQDGAPTVEVFRMGGTTHVEIKITFPGGVSGNFSGWALGSKFDCKTVPPDVVYCSGPLQKSVGAVTFVLMDEDTNAPVLTEVVVSPRPLAGNDPQPTEEPEAPPECTGPSITNPCSQ